MALKNRPSHICISDLRASILIMEQTDKILGKVTAVNKDKVHLHYEHFKNKHVPEVVLNAFQFTSQAVIKGFLLELSLKYLYILKYHKSDIVDDYIESIKVPSGHNLMELLEACKEDQFVIARLQTVLNGMDKDIIKQKIVENAKNFERWRYKYEDSPTLNTDGELIPNTNRKLVFSNSLLQSIFIIVKQLIDVKDIY